jgi:NADH-quinone oxidoreductase subunit G
MTQEFVNIEINGVPVKAPKGEMLIRVTDTHGAYVPRFCYHDKLAVAANCRMCLVEVEKAPKPLPACATPVTEGMKVFTDSPKAIGAQKATMEFLLINHPLDCPICDQGGECELQDLAMGFGRDISRYTERKRVVKDENLGPLIATDMTRCIHCTRCVRFTEEIAGFQELGMIGRGELMRVRSYVEKTVEHELSGNVIDLCPVGALVSKPYRFRARAWEMTTQPLVSPHDGVGSNLYGHVLRGRLMRVVPRANESINETWISDRDRFSYEGVYSPDRVTAPMVRVGDDWTTPGWESALEKAASALRDARSSLGALASASATIEELYLLNRIVRGVGSHNIDHRLRRVDVRDQESEPLHPSLGMKIADVDLLDGLLVVGSNLRREVPMLAHRVRKAAGRGGRVAFLNPAEFEYLFPVAASTVSRPTRHVADLAAVLSAVLKETSRKAPEHLASAIKDAKVESFHRDLATVLTQGERRAIWLGALAVRHPRYADLRALALAIAEASGASFGTLAEGANAAGAYLAGAVPHREAGGESVAEPGLSAREMLAKPLDIYLLLNVEPWADTLDSATLDVLENAKHVIALTPFASDQLKQVADIILPIGTFAEGSGTYVNLEGTWQSFPGAAHPVGEARPGWKVLRVLGNLLSLPAFDYQSSEDVREEVRRRVEAAGSGGTVRTTNHSVKTDGDGASVVDVPMYHVDALVRRAPSLQKTTEGRATAAVYRG